MVQGWRALVGDDHAATPEPCLPRVPEGQQTAQATTIVRALALGTGGARCASVCH